MSAGTYAASGGDWLDVAAASARVSASASAYTQSSSAPQDWRGRRRFAGPISWGVDRIFILGSRSSASSVSPVTTIVGTGASRGTYRPSATWPCQTRTSTWRSFATICSGRTSLPLQSFLMLKADLMSKTYLWSDRFVEGGRPSVGSVMRLKTLRNVLLPIPLRPMMPTASPCLISKLTSLRAQNSRLHRPGRPVVSETTGTASGDV